MLLNLFHALVGLKLKTPITSYFTVYDYERDVLFDMLHNLNILNITEELLLRGSAQYSIESKDY